MFELSIPGTRAVVTHVPFDLPGEWKLHRRYWKARQGELWVSLPEVAEFHVQGREQMTIRPFGPIENEVLQHYAMVTPMAGLIMLRGELPLHAAALEHPKSGRVVLLCAHSGTGKSTTAAALCLRGWRLLNDDIARITLDERGLLAWPGYQKLKLWADACDQLGIEHSELPVGPGPKRKYLWSPQRVDEPLALHSVVELRRPAALPPANMQLLRCPVTHAIGVLDEHTFRRRMMAPLGAGAGHHRLLVEMARQVPVMRALIDPALPPNEVADWLEERV